MWLPRDERWLLEGYYHLLGGPGERKSFYKSDLGKLLVNKDAWKTIKEYGRQGSNQGPPHDPNDMNAFKRVLKSILELENRWECVNNVLVKRGLVIVTQHQNESGVVLVELNLRGYDFGRRYACFLDRMGLLIGKYKWVGILVGFVTGFAALISYFPLVVNGVKLLFRALIHYQ